MSGDVAGGTRRERSVRAHLTVIGSRAGTGALARLGATTTAVLGRARGEVVVVHARDELARPGPVVVGVDGSAASGAAVEAAFAEAARRATTLVAVHCWTDVESGAASGMPEHVHKPELLAEAQSTLSVALAGLSARHPDVEVWPVTYLSAPRRHLLDWSRTAQLLVVGSRGRGAVAGLLLGSTSRTLVRRARCPVLVANLLDR